MASAPMGQVLTGGAFGMSDGTIGRHLPAGFRGNAKSREGELFTGSGIDFLPDGQYEDANHRQSDQKEKEGLNALNHRKKGERPPARCCMLAGGVFAGRK